MRIGLDLRCLPTDGTQGAGIAHAARHLCSVLIQSSDFRWVAFVPKGAEFFVGSAGTKVVLPDVSSRSLRKALQENPCDMVFVPSGAVPFGLSAPAVPWVHDLTIFAHPEWFPQSFMKRQLTTRLFLHGIRKAPFVLAVSEHTKNKIIERTGFPADKIIVTYEGGEDGGISKTRLIDLGKSILQKFRIERPFVMALGTIEPRKNLAMLIRTWKNILVDGKDQRCDFVLAGPWGWKYQDVVEAIDGLRKSKRFHRIEKLDDEERLALMSLASAVCVPSLDEGFGLVALEAMQCGTPVIASNRGALPEVVGEAGPLLDPSDEKAWAMAIELAVSPERPKLLNSVGLGAIKQALKKTDLKKDLFRPLMVNHETDEPVRKQAEKFTWKKTAEIVIGAFSDFV